MHKIWGYLIDIFIGILIMFVAVAIYFGLRTETVMKLVYENATDEFALDTKRNGVITIRDYENYMKEMGIGNSLFDIKFEHNHKIYDPEYRFKTIEEIIEEQNRAYEGSNDYHYKEVKTDRPHVDDPINDGNLNTETNESILAKAENNPSNPGHVHDESCYNGHRHIGKPVFLHEHVHTSSCIEFVSYIEIPCVCNTCHKSYTGGFVDYYWDQSIRGIVNNGTVLDGTRECPYCGSRYITSGEQIKYYQYSCDYNTVDGFMGSTEKTPYGVVYEYEMSNPVDNATPGTNISGCYAYHITKELSDSYEYAAYNTQHFINSAERAFNTMVHIDKFKGYCFIPRYIRLGLSITRGSNGRGPEIYELPNVCYVTYETYIDADGEIRFRFKNYWGTVGNAYSENMPEVYSGTDNPGFPTDVPAEQFANMFNSPRVNNWFKDFFNMDYHDRYYGDTYFDNHWFSTQYVDSRLPNSETTQYVNVCGFDHSQGTNRWVHTCGYEEDSTMDCDKIIVSLEPTNSIQTVYTNDPLITTAKATYKDGSTKIVVCTTSFDTSRIVRDREAIITYINVIDGVSYNHNTTITVTVIPRSKTCPKGHVYNMNPDGSDPGCPYCRTWIENLRIINPTTSPIVIIIGTTLKDNCLKLLATYMDGHTEEVIDGYIDNLDIEYLGTKPVTIGYKGASVTVMVTTICETIICDICGYEYNLYPDGTNPGCPRCISRVPVFTGNVMEYVHINNTEEILEELYIKGQYNFNIDDVFNIKVTNKSSNLAGKLLKKVYPSLTDRWFDIERSERIMAK